MNNFSLIIPLNRRPESPLDRLEIEDAICDLLDEDDGGELIGSGVFGTKEGPMSLDIQLFVENRTTMNRVVAILRSAGAPGETLVRFIDADKTVLLSDWVELE